MKRSTSFWVIICTIQLCVVVGNCARLSSLKITDPPGQILDTCQNLKDLSKIIIGLNDALDFYQDHISDLVLDAATGTRILEAQLNLVLKEPSINISRSLRRVLSLLYTKSQVISEQIVVSVEENEELAEDSKNNTLPWVKSSRLWRSPAIGDWIDANGFSTVAKSTKLSRDDKEALNETLSDSCIGDLFRNCKLSTSCAQAFLQKPHSQYSLTHQVIFMLIAEKESCMARSKRFKSKYENVEKISWVDYKAKLCENVWIEANSIAIQKFPSEFRDLLAEQIAVCSLAGHKQFLRADWLQEILSWQNVGDDPDSNGCFELVVNKDDEHAQQGERKKRSDVLLDTGIIGEGNCSVHFTAVAISALSMYLRNFMEFCF